jgi:hypothetical protein
MITTLEHLKAYIEARENFEWKTQTFVRGYTQTYLPGLDALRHALRQKMQESKNPRLQRSTDAMEREFEMLSHSAVFDAQTDTAFNIELNLAYITVFDYAKEIQKTLIEVPLDIYLAVETAAQVEEYFTMLLDEEKERRESVITKGEEELSNQVREAEMRTMHALMKKYGITAEPTVDK